MKVGVLQLNSTIGDFAGNKAKVLDAYRKAVAAGADIAISPELFLCGYPPRDLLLRPDFIEQNLKTLSEVAVEVGSVPLVTGYVDWNSEKPGRALRNACAFLAGGEIVSKVNKTLLPTYDVFDEDRYFEPSQGAKAVEWKGRKIGLTICEDIWNDEDFWPDRLYRRDPIKDMIEQRVGFVFNLSASPWHVGKERTRLEMLKKVAQDEAVPLVQVNMVGGNDELVFDGHSVALDGKGRIIALGKGFAEEVFIADLSENGSEDDIAWPSRQQQIFSALVLGTRDYVRKCGFKQVVLGLSGGIDSAVTAVVAVEALGAGNVMGVAMPSRFSSEGSWKDAEGLAKNLGIRYESMAIEPAFMALENQLKPIFKDLPRNEAEENLQSRLRGVTLMGLSNKFGSLVLTTGNKSEMAVGYCTLYGDMCGALAVIADVFKTDIFALARWINRERTIIPESTILKPPSAELRPDQTDQDSLPPYDVLDEILDAYVVRNMSRGEIIALGHPAEVVNDVINKVTFSEYKRRQAAPGLKVSTRAFGMGRRIPIAQRFRT